MSKRKDNDPVFNECMDQFETPANAVGVGVAAWGHSPLSAVAGVLAHRGVLEAGEAVCDGTLTSGALGPQASYFDAKVGYHPEAAPPSFDLHSGAGPVIGDGLHPSYAEAKLGYVPGVDAAPAFESEPDTSMPQAHLDRNQWQADLVPERMPAHMPFEDPHTGVIWSPDSRTTETVWHGADNDCFRGTLPHERVEALHNDPSYRDAFAQVNAHHGYSVDRTIPGAQACYDDMTGKLVDHGPHAGTWDFASPSVPGQSFQHLHMDVAPDWHADNYTGFNSVPAHNGGHFDHGSGYDSGHSGGGADSGGGHSDSGHSDTSSHDSGGGGI